ncbi:hypothetical protein WJX81_007833 [Elliptochloris bilobata]|uniref:VOC domain-containing protein n=1 Tax=Elliptochloris bilobata TaxID=381761 RepID=A0AAW1S2P3_9CHLO
MAQQAPAKADQGYHVEESETYLGEKFWKALPPKEMRPAALWMDDVAAREADADAPPVPLVALNHCALGVSDLDNMANFYVRVLGFQRQPRPPFPFGGEWLTGGGLTLHLIDDDPTIPHALGDWRDRYNADEPEPWYIRRGAHKAFEVASLADMEARLKRFGVEYHKFIVPGTNAAQIFLWDPEGNGVELGEGYNEIAASLKGMQPT